MTQKRLLDLFPRQLNAAVEEKFLEKGSITISGGGNYSSKVFVLADAFRKTNMVPALWIVNDKDEQGYVAQACEEWFGVTVLSFSMEENAHINKDVSVRNQIHLLETLKTLTEKENKIIVAPYLSLMQPTPLYDDVKKNTIKIKTHEQRGIVDVFEQLISCGYTVSPDAYLEKGTYLGTGNVLNVFPVNTDTPVRIEFDFDSIGDMMFYNQEDGAPLNTIKELKVYPINLEAKGQGFFEYIPDGAGVVEDELEVVDEFYNEWDMVFSQKKQGVKCITFTSFPEDGDRNINLRYMSVLKYQDFLDLSVDLKEKHMREWMVAVFTKHKDEAVTIFNDKKIPFAEGPVPFNGSVPFVRVIEVGKNDLLPHAFQNTDLKTLIVSDKEVANLKEEKGSKVNQKVFWEFLSGLKQDDLVVHIDHGIARFDGLERRTVDGVTREYLKLGYAENDKLFVPIDQADKVNKFIGGADEAPRLSRLGSSEWTTIKKKAKQEGVSVNSLVWRIIKEGLGLKKKPRNIVFTDLDNLAGTWSEKEYSEFQKKIADLEKIDENMWK